MQNDYPLITALKKPFSLGLFVLSSGLFFAANYWAMAVLPGSNGFQCIIGQHLNPPNLFLSAVLSLAVGLFVAGLWEQLDKKKAKGSFRANGVSGFAMVLGTLTSFCTICTLPLVGLFGVSSFLTFMAENQLMFKVVSVIVFGFGLLMLNSQLREQCGVLCQLKK